MNSESKKIQSAGLGEQMAAMGVAAREAAAVLATASAERKHAALTAMAESIWKNREAILNANALDMESAREKGISGSFLDRLELSSDRVRGICDGIRAIGDLPDPVGDVIARWERPNGLEISRVRTPLGVIGVIFESRPNVAADAGALCLKAGNAVILRGGSDSFHSVNAIHECMKAGLVAADLPTGAIQVVATTDRAAVGVMLSGLGGTIDVIVPRGGKGLVARVQAEARVPVFAHLEGLCHVYVDKSADLEMAKAIVVNAKMRRTGICGAAETLLVDKTAAASHLNPVLDALMDAGCEIRGDVEVCKVFPGAVAANEDDWATEYLAPVISVALVDGIDGAIDHIRKWSSSHTEAVIAEDGDVVSRFFNEVDSAILLHNASTQFADGGEFGMGAEIGIATGKMHARGPVGVEQLTSFKYVVRGTGQVRAS